LSAPGIESGLKRVDASLLTGYGRISSSWSVDGDTLNWRLTVPPNTGASVVIPAAALETVLEGGQPAAGQPGIKQAVFERGLFRAEVGSGEYRFTSRLTK